MRDFTSELFRREIPRPLDPRPHGRAALVAAGPCAGPAWTSHAEGGAGTSRADAPRIDPAELFRREIPRPLHPRPYGRAALVAAGPCAGPAWTSRAEGGAGTSRAAAQLVWGCGISLRNCSDVKSRVSCTSATREGRACRGRALRRACLDTTRRGRRGYFARRRAAGLGTQDFTSELFRREIARPLDPRPHGRAALVAAGPCAALDQHPTHGQIHSLPATVRRAKSPRRPRRVASARASHVGWP